jgi:hypothetical protein
MIAREHKRIAVVLPVGPNDAEGAFDTLASAVYYLDRPRVIVVVDDTGQLGFSRRARELSADIFVLPAPPKAPGGLGGLWVKIAAGYDWVLQKYEPDVVLRLDADALIIGAGIEEYAAKEFVENPETGLLGSYRIGPDGGIRDWSWPARRLRIEAGVRGLRHPHARTRLRDFVKRARNNSYIDGEHALGGGYIHSFKAADDIYAKGWFKDRSFATSKLGEDHIMALVTVAAGYRVADFGGPADPMALTWKGLPSHPDKLLARNKLVTHSVRSWENLGEAEVRQIFRAARA